VESQKLKYREGNLKLPKCREQKYYLPLNMCLVRA
jgi:hypothetical protein